MGFIIADMSISYSLCPDFLSCGGGGGEYLIGTCHAVQSFLLSLDVLDLLACNYVCGFSKFILSSFFSSSFA